MYLEWELLEDRGMQAVCDEGEYYLLKLVQAEGETSDLLWTMLGS